MPKRSPTMDIASLNRGRVRHPLFGNRKVWFDEAVRPGFIDQAVDRTRPKVHAEVLKAIDHTLSKVTRG